MSNLDGSWIHAKLIAEVDPVEEGEVIPIGWDFAEELSEGEALSSGTFVVTVDLIMNGQFLPVTPEVLKESVVRDGDSTDSMGIAVLHNMDSDFTYRVRFEAPITSTKTLIGTIYVPCIRA